MILTDDEIQYLLDGCHSSNTWTLVERTVAATIAKLAAGVRVEPVAWIGDSPTKGNGQRLFWTKKMAKEYANNLTPLYTSPPDHTAAMKLALEALKKERDLHCIHANDAPEYVTDAIVALEKEIGE